MNPTNSNLPEEVMPSALPDPCKKCGSGRIWSRVTKKDRIGWKPKCRQCHRESLARDRRKHGGAAARNKRWETRNRAKALAHRRVESALRLGNLAKEACAVCGSDEVHAHHEDYSKPLEIVWLCPFHHKERHREIEAEAAS